MIESAKEAVLSVANRMSRCDIRDTIVVAGSPRSGTTWLAEMLHTLPDYKYLHEPLHLDNNPEAKDAGFRWRNCIAPEEKRPQMEAYLEKVLSGQVPYLWSWRFHAQSAGGKLLEQTKHQKLLVKFIRMNRALHWLHANFEVKGTVFIIRHPCAVVASMLKREEWDGQDIIRKIARKESQPEAVPSIPDATFEKFRPVLKEVSSEAEAFAVSWCLDHYIPLFEHASGAYPWTIVTYEELLSNGVSELERIGAALGVQIPSEAQEQLAVASLSASDSLDTDIQRQLAKWKTQLTNEQMEGVLRIVGAFGLDFYTEDVHPDYGRLMKYQR